jgi:spore germination protein KC
MRKLGTKTMGLFVILSVLLTGCWSSFEVNDLAIVSLMGIDVSESKEYEVTVLIIRPQAAFSQSARGGGGGQSPSLVISAKGKSLFEALHNMSKVLSKRMYLGHLQAVIFGEDAARQDVGAALDMIKRQTLIRPNVDLLATKEKAVDIIKTEPILEGTLGAEINQMIKYSNLSASTMVLDVSQFAYALSSDTMDPFTGEISSKPVKGMKVYGDGQKESAAVSLQGAGVFKNGRLIGWMNQDETRGVLWALGRMRTGVNIIKCPGEDQGTISLELTRSSSDLVPKMVDGQLQMLIDINLESNNISEITCSELHLTPEKIEHLNALLENQVKGDISKALKKAQKKWEVDVFKFGRAIYHKYPNEWSKMEPQWRNGGLKNLEVRIKVKAYVRRPELRNDPLEPNEAR